MARLPSRVATRPPVLSALTLLGLTDSDVAHMLQVSGALVSMWNHKRWRINPTMHGAMWFVVARLTGAIGAGDLPPLPVGVGLRKYTDAEAAHIRTVLGAAAQAAAANAPDAQTLAKGAVLGQQCLDRLEIRARQERLQVLDQQLAHVTKAMARLDAAKQRALREAATQAQREAQQEPVQ